MIFLYSCTRTHLHKNTYLNVKWLLPPSLRKSLHMIPRVFLGLYDFPASSLLVCAAVSKVLLQATSKTIISGSHFDTFGALNGNWKKNRACIACFRPLWSESSTVASAFSTMWFSFPCFLPSDMTTWRRCWTATKTPWSWRRWSGLWPWVWMMFALGCHWSAGFPPHVEWRTKGTESVCWQERPKVCSRYQNQFHHLNGKDLCVMMP